MLCHRAAFAHKSSEQESIEQEVLLTLVLLTGESRCKFVRIHNAIQRKRKARTK